MARIRIPVPSTFYKTIAKNISSQEIENLYRISSVQSGKDSSYLMATSGLEEFCDIGVNAPIWGMKEFNDLLYVCCGSKIYTVNQTGIVTEKGDIGTVTANVQFEDNGTNIVVLKNVGDLWEITSSGVNQVADADYISSSSISQSFGYFILPITGSNEWQISDQDSVSFSGFVAKTESSPNNIIRTVQNSGETWFFKTKSTEVWQFTGDNNFPYIRTAVLNKGAVAKNAFAQYDTSLFWLGNDKRIYESSGYQQRAISSEAIDQLIAEMNILNDAIFWVYVDGGQVFLTCQFPSEKVTYEANLSIRDEAGYPEWHKRTSNGLTFWRANCYENAFNENFVGDYANGKIYKIKFNEPQENGVNVIRSFTTSYFFDIDNPISFDRIELDIESGLGKVAGDGSNPIAYLSWSDDYGHTFSNQYHASVGRQGQYKYLASWLGKGTARKRCLKFTINDPIKVRIAGINADIQKLEA